MKKVLKRVASFALAAILILVMAVPAFAEENCIKEKKAIIGIQVDFDDIADKWELRGEGVEVSLYNAGSLVKGCTKVVNENQFVIWELDKCDSWVSDAFELVVTAQEGYYSTCYEVEASDVVQLWPFDICNFLGTSDEEISSDEVTSDDELYYEEELTEEEIPEDFEGCVVPASCEESRHVDCDKCGEKYDCSKRHLCSCKHGWRVCEDCFEIYDCSKKHDCCKKTCPDCHKKYDCRKKHECHPCPPCPPTPQVEYEGYYGTVTAKLLTKTLTVVNYVDDEAAKDTYFGFDVKIASPVDQETIIYKKDAELRDHNRNSDIFEQTVPQGSFFVVTETINHDYKVKPEGKVISGVLTEDCLAEFLNYKGSTPPGPTPGPTPTPGGGSGSSVILTDAPAEAAPQGPVVEAAPKTGMPMKYYVWLVTIALSIGAAAVVVFKKNKKAA